MRTVLCILLSALTSVVWAKKDDSIDLNDPMYHLDPTVYDNAYIVDTINISNPVVISYGFPGSYSIFSFVTDSVTATKIVREISKIKKWAKFEKYLKNEKSLINSCYVYLIATDYDYAELAFNCAKRRKDTFYYFTNKTPINEKGETACIIDGVPIEIRHFSDLRTDKFILLLVNVGSITGICMDCPKEDYEVPAISPYNKYVKVVIPL